MTVPPIWVAAPSLQVAKAFAMYDIGLRPHWWRFVSDPARTLRGLRDEPITTITAGGDRFDRHYWDEIDRAVHVGRVRYLPTGWWHGIVFDHDHESKRLRDTSFVGPGCARCGKHLDAHYSYGVEITGLLGGRLFPIDYITKDGGRCCPCAHEEE